MCRSSRRFDLHANVSDRMVTSIDAFIGYRTNPHLDMRERGAEAAAAMRETARPARGTEPRPRVRLPIVPPTVTMLTAAGPYAEMIASRPKPRSAGEIMNVSVMGGFAFGDTAKNGLTVIVTAQRDRRNRAPPKASPRDRAIRLGQPRAVLCPSDAARRRGAEGAGGRERSVIAGTCLCRRRRQSRRRRARQHDVSAARVVRGRRQGRAVRHHLRSRPRRRGAPSRAALQFRRAQFNRDETTNSPKNGVRRRGSWR